MTIVIEVRPEVEAEIARQAALQGQPVEAYAASLIEEAVIAPGEKTFDLERAKAAGERIRELRKGVTLGDLTIRELIDEGRR